MPPLSVLQFHIFLGLAAGFNSVQRLDRSQCLQFTLAGQMNCSVVIPRPWPTFPCVKHVASDTWQFFKFCLEKSLAFRQFTSACKMNCIVVILRPWLTFPCVIHVISDTPKLLEFPDNKSSAFRQFSSALKINCIAVTITSMPTFQCVLSLCQRHSGIVTLSRRTHTDDAQIVH
jgi:hypothetical protein